MKSNIPLEVDNDTFVRMWALWFAMYNLHRRQMEAQKND